MGGVGKGDTDAGVALTSTAGCGSVGCGVPGSGVSVGGRLVAVGWGVDDGDGVAVTVAVSVGGNGITERGSTPGGMTMTPGVPALGGVTTINASIKSGVGVKVGAGMRVGTGVGVARAKRSPRAHPVSVMDATNRITSRSTARFIGHPKTTAKRRRTVWCKSGGVDALRTRVVMATGPIDSWHANS